MNTEIKVIKSKVDLLQLAKQLVKISQARKLFGYCRVSLYRFKDLYDQGGELALRELNRRKPSLKNRIEGEVEKVVVQIAFDYPAFGQLRASNELKKKGVFISPAGVKCVWLRNDLET